MRNKFTIIIVIFALALSTVACSCGNEDANKLKNSPTFSLLETQLDKYTSSYKSRINSQKRIPTSYFQNAAGISEVESIVSNLENSAPAVNAALITAEKLLGKENMSVISNYCYRLSADSTYISKIKMMTEAHNYSAATRNGYSQLLLLIKVYSYINKSGNDKIESIISKAFTELTNSTPTEVTDSAVSNLSLLETYRSSKSEIRVAKKDKTYLSVFFKDLESIDNIATIQDYVIGYKKIISNSSLDIVDKERFINLIEFTTPIFKFWYKAQKIAACSQEKQDK